MGGAACLTSRTMRRGDAERNCRMCVMLDMATVDIGMSERLRAAERGKA